MGAVGTLRPRLGRVSTTEAIVQSLASDILDGTLVGGTHLREIELADRYGVSRHSVRAGMAELVHRGLLTRETSRGFFVPVLTADDIRDVYFVRELIEREAVRYLCGARRLLEPVADAVDRFAQIVDGELPWSEAVARHVAVHRAMVAGVGSPRLSRAYLSIEMEFRLSNVPAQFIWPRGEWVAEHRQLLSLMADGDARAALEFFTNDIARGREALLAAVRSLPNSRQGGGGGRSPSPASA